MKTRLFQFKSFFCIIFCFISITVNCTNYFSDPINGSMNNSGSSQSPWSSLDLVFQAKKQFVAGDTIFLRNGNHGYAVITGVNSGFVVITPELGHNPVISRIRVSDPANSISANFWKLYKLTVQSEATGKSAIPSYPLIEIWPLATNITVSSCLVTSNLNTADWTRTDWRNRCNNGIHTRAKLNSNYIIENNVIKNTAFSLAISSSNTIVRGNTIQYFTNDANRILGSDILYENNKSTDIIKVMTVLENHDDLFQGFTTKSGGEGVDTLKNVIVRKNIFITCTDTTRAFRGTTQGMGMFDGPFYNWTVENNIVLVDHWHAISFYGGINCKIINNTVLDPYPYTPYNSYDDNSTTTGPAWIYIGQKSTTIPSINNIVRNNIVHNTVSIGSVSMGTASNNIIVGTINNFKNYFVNATDLSNPEKFDLHLKPGCAAIDAGDATYAPTTDFDGISRPQGLKCDIGAYEYVVPNAISEIDASRKQISISPNPFSNELGIQSTDGFTKGDKIQIYTIGGQLVYRNTLTNTTRKIELNNLSGIPTGLLLLKIENLAGLKFTSKLIKKD